MALNDINSHILASDRKGLVSLVDSFNDFSVSFFLLSLSKVRFLNLSELPCSLLSFTSAFLDANLFLFLMLSQFFLRLFSSVVTTSLLCCLIWFLIDLKFLGNVFFSFSSKLSSVVFVTY